MDRELPDKHGILLEMYDERAFSRDAVQLLPELAEELTQNENLLHVQVSVLGRIVQEEIARNAPRLTPAILGFLEQALCHPRAISEIANSIQISFVDVDDMRATETGREILGMMPPTVRSVLTGGAS